MSKLAVGLFSSYNCLKTCIKPKLKFTLSVVTVTIILMKDYIINRIQLQAISCFEQLCIGK